MNHRKELDKQMDIAKMALDDIFKQKSLVSNNSIMHKINHNKAADALVKGLIEMGKCKMINSEFLNEIKPLLFQSDKSAELWHYLKNNFCID